MQNDKRSARKGEIKIIRTKAKKMHKLGDYCLKEYYTGLESA